MPTPNRHLRFTLYALRPTTLIALAILTACAPAARRLPDLQNPGFEAGWTRATKYWTQREGPLYTQFPEIFTPAAWTTWWYQDVPCSGTPTYRTGRPEVRIVSHSPDPTRIRSGHHATMLFTLWRCHHFGLFQRVPATPGARYRFQAYAHSWYSRCSDAPHGPPLDGDCTTRIDWAHDWLRVGIDPTGATDPWAPTVVWSSPLGIYGGYGPPLTVGPVEAQADAITVFFWSQATHPLKHNDVYVDDIALHIVTHQLFLPLAAR